MLTKITALNQKLVKVKIACGAAKVTRIKSVGGELNSSKMNVQTKAYACAILQRNKNSVIQRVRRILTCRTLQFKGKVLKEVIRRVSFTHPNTVVKTLAREIYLTDQK